MEHLIKPLEAYTISAADYEDLDPTEKKELLERYQMIGIQELIAHGDWFLLPKN